MLGSRGRRWVYFSGFWRGVSESKGKDIPGAKAPVFGWAVIVRAEARTYLRSKGNGNGKRRSRSLRDDSQKSNDKSKSERKRKRKGNAKATAKAIARGGQKKKRIPAG
jgi:hypothetical protein